MQIGVVGLGLMGGSLLRRLAAPGGRSSCAGWDADAETRAGAATAGLSVAASLQELAGDSDVLFVAVPLPELGSVFTQVADAAEPGRIVSDLTSVKQPVREAAAAYGFTFVGGHPMAGTEESGFAASHAELLAGAAWVLTLDEETDLAAWLAVAGVITTLGCRVVPTTSPEHDRAVARVSHLPHLVAAALTLAGAGDPLALALAAGSFRDATRVAGTRPELTAAMCAGNAAALDVELLALAARLEEARQALRDPDRLIAWFASAARVRGAWPPVTDAVSEVPIDRHLRDRLLAVGRAGGHVSSISQSGVVVCMPSAPPGGQGAR